MTILLHKLFYLFLFTSASHPSSCKELLSFKSGRKDKPQSIAFQIFLNRFSANKMLNPSSRRSFQGKKKSCRSMFPDSCGHQHLFRHSSLHRCSQKTLRIIHPDQEINHAPEQKNPLSKHPLPQSPAETPPNSFSPSLPAASFPPIPAPFLAKTDSPAPCKYIVSLSFIHTLLHNVQNGVFACVFRLEKLVKSSLPPAPIRRSCNLFQVQRIRENNRPDLLQKDPSADKHDSGIPSKWHQNGNAHLPQPGIDASTQYPPAKWH